VKVGFHFKSELDDGSRITEGAVIDQFVADKTPSAHLLPPAGTLERIRVQEWVHFIGTEMHKQLAPLFNPQLAEEAKVAQREKIGKRFDYVQKELGSKTFLTGDAFTVADAYLDNMLCWTGFTAIDLPKWPGLKAF
jgi:glutathione S-transferase